MRIEIAGGPTLELKQGEMALLRKGAESLWHGWPERRAAASAERQRTTANRASDASESRTRVRWACRVR